MPTILVTNDDGISSPGIKALSDALQSIGEVYTVAPETEQSAVSHALTIHRPLKFEEVDQNTFFVNGTPTDCVIIAVSKLLPKKPDIIISGINHGGNLADNISYSGTVAAAMEGMLLGIPSIAISLVLNRSHDRHRIGQPRFDNAADYAKKLAATVLEREMPGDTLLNVNVPDDPKINGVKITHQGKLVYDNGIQEIADPSGRKYYWIGGGEPQWGSKENTDFDAVHNGYISVTPVHLNLTNYDAVKFLKEKWEI